MIFLFLVLAAILFNEQNNFGKGHYRVGGLVLLLYIPSQQLWSLRDGQFT